MSTKPTLKRGGGATAPDDVPRSDLEIFREITCIVIRFLTYKFLLDYWTDR